MRIAITLHIHLMTLFAFLLNKMLMRAIVSQIARKAKIRFCGTIPVYMFDFYQKRKIRTVVNSPITQGVILLLVFMVGWSAYVRFDIAMEMRERRLQVEAQTAALEARQDTLQQQVEYLTSERGIEAELRRQFDVSLPGEQVIVILEDDAAGATVTPLASDVEPESSKHYWFQFWR